MSVPELIDLDPSPAAVVRDTVPVNDLPAFFGRAFGTVAATVARQGVALVGEPFAFYAGAPTEVIEVAAGFRVAAAFEPSGDVVSMELPGEPAVTMVHRGPYDSMDEAYQEMHRWMAAKGLTPAGHMWESYLSDPGTEPDPSAWQTKIVWPVDD